MRFTFDIYIYYCALYQSEREYPEKKAANREGKRERVRERERERNRGVVRNFGTKEA